MSEVRSQVKCGKNQLGNYSCSHNNHVDKFVRFLIRLQASKIVILVILDINDQKPSQLLCKKFICEHL